MAQKFIKGQEATCGVIEIKNKIAPLPPTKIIANLGKFYDYKSKYSKGGSTHVCPADFKPEINKQIQNLALQAHIALGCKGMSRSDIFVDENEKLWLIETNTIPGMTPTSLFPEAAQIAGINFSDILDLIIASSLHKQI
jgi:D-alanine-D-alanine ligase